MIISPDGLYMHSNYPNKFLNTITASLAPPTRSFSSYPLLTPYRDTNSKLVYMPTNHRPLELPQACSLKPPLMDPCSFRHFPHYEPPKGEEDSCERERLFEKPLTPSDVGKLNRLVIPKQHAEKYFPLYGDSGEKLLSFEDEAGKGWRFRYSYWTSSQSYVLTKGWSRFVKEKRLDAGDVVVFERKRSNGDRLFIGWKRRGASAAAQYGEPTVAAARVENYGLPWNSPVYCAIPQSYTPKPIASYLCFDAAQRNCPHHAGEETGVEEKAAPAWTNSKRLRLFGVNLDCGPINQPEIPTTTSCPCFTGPSCGHWFQLMPAATDPVPPCRDQKEIEFFS